MTNPATESASTTRGMALPTSAYGDGKEPEEIPEEIPVEAPVEAPAIKSAKAPRTQKQLDVLAKARVKAAETIKARKASREALRNKPPVFPEGASIRSESQPVFPVGANIRSESPPVFPVPEGAHSRGANIRSESPPVFTEGDSIRSEEESPIEIISQRAQRQDMKRSVTMSREELDQLLEESSTRTYNKLKIIDAPQPKLIYNSELGVYTYQP
jgi:hypothetical protein